jgi:GAF domain-containing protein
MGRFAVDLQSRVDVAEVLNRVVDVAVSEVPGAEMAGVTIIGRDGAQTPAATDPLVEQIDAQQYATGEGPCLDAASAEPVVRSGDLAWENRWPAFAPRAVELGVASILAVQMFVDAGAVGALNLYAKRPAAFDADAEHIAVPLAMHAAVALVASRTEAGLRIALSSRDVIGQAKGILMERFRVSADEAFGLLIASSQHTHRKLREVADQLAVTGELILPERGSDAEG